MLNRPSVTSRPNKSRVDSTESNLPKGREDITSGEGRRKGLFSHSHAVPTLQCPRKKTSHPAHPLEGRTKRSVEMTDFPPKVRQLAREWMTSLARHDIEPSIQKVLKSGERTPTIDRPPTARMSSGEWLTLGTACPSKSRRTSRHHTDTCRNADQY